MQASFSRILYSWLHLSVFSSEFRGCLALGFVPQRSSYFLVLLSFGPDCVTSTIGTSFMNFNKLTLTPKTKISNRCILWSLQRSSGLELFLVKAVPCFCYLTANRHSVIEAALGEWIQHGVIWSLP